MKENFSENLSHKVVLVALKPLLFLELCCDLSKPLVPFKDGGYYCYCAYVLRISRHSDFLWVVLINTGIFMRGSKPCGESRT